MYRDLSRVSLVWALGVVLESWGLVPVTSVQRPAVLRQRHNPVVLCHSCVALRLRDATGLVSGGPEVSKAARETIAPGSHAGPHHRGLGGP